MGSIKDKIFPKNKEKEKIQVIAELKKAKFDCEKKFQETNKDSKKSKLEALRELQKGNKDIARQMLIKKKKYDVKAKNYFNMINRIESQLDAIQEAASIESIHGAIVAATALLGKLVENLNSELIEESIQKTNGYIEQIDMAGELMGEDMEQQSGFDVEDDLNQLETELLISGTGGVPPIPEDSEDEDIEKELNVKNKKEIETEIKKLQKELDI